MTAHARCRNIIKKPLILLAGFCVLAFSVLAEGTIPGIAGTVTAGQRFEYDLKWGMVLAGHSVMEEVVTPEGPSIISNAVSADWITKFYPVRDFIQSVLRDTETQLPSVYRIRTVEGKHRKDREVKFIHNSADESASGKAIYFDHIKNSTSEHEVPQDAYDPLSAFFRIKGMDLKVGESVYVKMFDSKKVWDVEVKVLRKQKVNVPAGTFDTVVIQPIMKSEGIFDSKGDIYIWLTDDERRVPVKVKTEVMIGSVTALLTGGRY